MIHTQLPVFNPHTEGREKKKQHVYTINITTDVNNEHVWSATGPTSKDTHRSR